MLRIYSLVLRLGLIVLSPFLLLRSRRYWPSLSDRLGYLKIPQLQGAIWLHAVSVGEVKAVEKLIERIRERFPDRPLVISTTTPTGQQLAREKRGVAAHTFYFPIDLRGPVKRALDRVRPSLVIIAETEIWPTFMSDCRRRGIPVMMINGRISDKSLPRYRAVRRWIAPVLADYAVLGMQSESDSERIIAIGAEAKRVEVFGNLKYDVTPSARVLDPKLIALLRVAQPLWIAASTMPGEDELVLDAYQTLRQSHPALKLMIAPRHPERGEAIAGLVKAIGLTFARRSIRLEDADVLILDTVGELAAAFEFAVVVFMGGSLVPRGGHNILEPARFSKPVIFGPHMENFRDMARAFLSTDAAIQISSPDKLASAILRVLNDADLASRLGRNANRVVMENTGATERVMAAIEHQVFKT